MTCPSGGRLAVTLRFKFAGKSSLVSAVFTDDDDLEDDESRLFLKENSGE